MFITATRATFRPCMGLLSARCSSSGGSTWRLQSACELLRPLIWTFPREMKMRHSMAQSITTTRNQTAAMNCHTYIAPVTMEWKLVSCIWRLRSPTSTGLLCQFECRFAAGPSVYVFLFSPTGHPVNNVMILLHDSRTSSSITSNSKPTKTAVTTSSEFSSW